jgi:hypothetical protein
MALPREVKGRLWAWIRTLLLALGLVLMLITGAQFTKGATSPHGQTPNDILHAALAGSDSGACRFSSVRVISLGSTLVTELKGEGWLRTDAKEGYQTVSAKDAKVTEEVRRYGNTVFGRHGSSSPWTRWMIGDNPVASPEVTAPGSDPVLYMDVFNYLRDNWRTLTVQPTIQRSAETELPALRVELNWADLAQAAREDGDTWRAFASSAGRPTQSLLILQSQNQIVLYFALPLGPPAKGEGQPDSLTSGQHMDVSVGCMWMPRGAYPPVPTPRIAP